MKEKNPFNLDVVSVRLVKDAPIMSGHPITKPEDAVLLLGKYLCEMDRKLFMVSRLLFANAVVVILENHSREYLCAFRID